MPPAALSIILGTTNGLTRSGPFSIQLEAALFDLVQAADAAADDHAAAEGIFLGEIEARILHRLPAGDHRKLREPVEPLDLFLLGEAVGLGDEGGRPVFRSPVVHVAAELHLEAVGIENAQRMNAALPSQEALPEIFDLAG